MWRPSSREISSFEKVSPGINPRFLSQNIDANDPEKKIPSTDANAMILSAYEALLIQFKAHCAFFFTAGTVSIALKRLSFSTGSESRNIFLKFETGVLNCGFLR